MAVIFLDFAVTCVIAFIMVRVSLPRAKPIDEDFIQSDFSDLDNTPFHSRDLDNTPYHSEDSYITIQ